jgi:PKD repeat protein
MRRLIYFLLVGLVLLGCSEKYELNPVAPETETPVVKARKGKLSVLIKPVKADVYVDGEKKASAVSEFSDSLKAGDHELKVIPSDTTYWTFLQKVEIPSGGLQVVNVELRRKAPNTGIVLIRAEDKESDAALTASYKILHSAGQTYEGKTPASQILPLGAAVVRASKSGYYSYEKNIQVEAGRTVSLVFQMQKMDTTETAVVKVLSNVDEAQVYFKSDGKIAFEGKLSNNSLEVKLKKNSYLMEVVKPGFKVFQKFLTLQSDTTIEAVLEKLPSDEGLVSVVTFPSGAQVEFTDSENQIAGSMVSNGFLTLKKGAYIAQITRDGYEVKIVQFVLDDYYEISEILIPALPDSAYLVAVSRPTANLYLNGEYYGKTNQTYALTPGVYAWWITGAGYKVESGIVSLKAGETKVINRILTPLPHPIEKGVFAALSVPQEANVAVINVRNDTVAEFQTPYQAELPLGSYIAIASKKGYSSKDFAFQLSENKTFVVHKFLLEKSEPPQPVNHDPVISEFKAVPNQGYAPLETIVSAAFSDVDGDTLSFSLDFGDNSPKVGGEDSSGFEVKHTYQNPGLYEVELIVTDGKGGETKEKITVLVEERPTPINHDPVITLFQVEPTQGEAPLTIRYKAEAEDEDGDLLSFVWQFGNSQMAVGDSGKYTYREPGLYTVEVTVYDGKGGKDSKSIAVLVTEPPPPANHAPIITLFEVTPTQGEAPLTIHYRVEAKDKDGDLLSFVWEFGNSQMAVGDSGKYTYREPGLYTVELFIYDGEGGVAYRAKAVLVLEKEPELKYWSQEFDEDFYVRGSGPTTNKRDMNNPEGKYKYLIFHIKYEHRNPDMQIGLHIPPWRVVVPDDNPNSPSNEFVVKYDLGDGFIWGKQRQLTISYENGPKWNRGYVTKIEAYYLPLK